MQKKKTAKLGLGKKAISKLNAKSLTGGAQITDNTKYSQCNCSPLCVPPYTEECPKTSA